jgi:cytochrome c biogenesis protein CcmG/thiol:disulfide interchange protein DsbE
MMLLAGLMIGVGLGLILIVLIGTAGGWFGRISDTAPALGPQVSNEAPNFSLNALSGEKIQLAELKGTPILINFWATWCGPCRLEMPLLAQYQNRYPHKLRILAVNAGESEVEVRAFLEELGASPEILLDPQESVTDLYRVNAFPTSLFLDSEGIIRSMHVGILNEDQLVGYLERIGVAQ